ncbi:hypothetical protein GQ457_16G015250 [Hibiscus cannabinus]
MERTDRFIQKTDAFINRTEMKLQNHDATLKSLETQVGQISQILNTRPIGGFPSDTEVAKGATHEQCKAITTRSGKILMQRNNKRGTAANPSAAIDAPPHILLGFCANSLVSGICGFVDFASFGKGVSELCSRDYSGGLSRDLSVISRWDSRSNLDVSRRNQVVIFLRELCVLRYLRDPGNEEVRFLRSTIRSRRLEDQIVREFVSS